MDHTSKDHPPDPQSQAKQNTPLPLAERRRLQGDPPTQPETGEHIYKDWASI